MENLSKQDQVLEAFLQLRAGEKTHKQLKEAVQKKVLGSDDLTFILQISNRTLYRWRK
ncbi:hypothetical protein [Pedobacter hartonius]|uniref:Uncharacterized protein n=1 Tax=Pedobacter hartonius TaxID=425514 RepID=A0A1H4H9V3_9SPHI|nr:hypothetical protein [Pedobacter hartonius]SEB18579.1 hypothetical protein SAMN05443550_114126 [Pedobacter hartonius]